MSNLVNMSRIGKQPIIIPEKVSVSLKNSQIVVRGPLGELKQTINSNLKVVEKNAQLLVSRQNNTRLTRALHGLTRSLIANMITGVTQGFSKTLELHGTGYRAKLEDKKLVLQIGFSHPVMVEPPEGIEFKLEGEKKIIVAGIDKQLVGNTAAMIRAKKKPEPYKGKGIRYQGEVVKKKPGKAAKAGLEEGKYE